MFYREVQAEHIKKCFKKYDTVVFYDLETTGFDPNKDRIIEFSACKYAIRDGKNLEKVDEITVYIRPEFNLPEKITEITGYTDEFLADKQCENDACLNIFAFLKGVSLVGGYNNDHFDNKFLKQLYSRNSKEIEFIDSIDVFIAVKQILAKEKLPSHKLSTIAAYLGVDKGIDFHKANSDVLATVRVFTALSEEIFSFARNETPKNTPIVRSVAFWEGFKGYSRIYVETNFGTVYFDIRGKSWNGKDVDVNTLNMPYLIDEVISLTGVESEDGLCKFKGKVRA